MKAILSVGRQCAWQIEGIQRCGAGGTMVADGPGWHNRTGGPRKSRGDLAERPAGGWVTGTQINREELGENG